jgi:hypothetical protein
MLPIFNGDKIKFCYLQEPNPARSPVIAVHNELPAQLNLDKYVDRSIQFEKAFLEPLNSILRVIGWQSKRTTNLEDAFA